MLSSAVPTFAAGGQTGSANGTVVDGNTNLPIAGAKVNLVSPSGNYVATTDSKGTFNFLGVQVDTYTISITYPGYEPQANPAVTITGDQVFNLGTVRISKLRTIGTVRARSISGAYQPGQTTDSITVSGSRIDEAVGKTQSNNERDLVTSVPGATLTNSGAISIRGGLTTEVGYQFDGIPYSEPFLNQNASSNRFNGVGSLQVVEGAGDATQGNIGGGVVNIIPKRGTYPGFANLDLEVGGPNYDHTLDFEGGFATQNGRISDYFSYNGARTAPYYGPSGVNSASIGNFYSTLYQTNDDFVNNFVFRFGHNNNQSIQVLYQNRLLRDYGFAGGYTDQQYYPYDPSAYLGSNGAASYFESVLGASSGLAYFQHIIGLNKGVPSSALGPTNLLQAEQNGSDPTTLTKIEYDNSFTPNLLLQARYFNFDSQLTSSSETGALGGNVSPGVVTTGGQRSGLIADLQDQIGTKNTLTFHVEYENQKPQFDDSTPQSGLVTNLANNVDGVSGQSLGGAPSLADFLPLVNGVCPVTGGAPSLAGCYLDTYFPNGIPRIPISGIGYHGSLFQTSAVALRDQFHPTNKLNIDVGVREDGANYKIAPFSLTSDLPFAIQDPSDVPLNTISGKFSNPRAVEPRAAVAFQLGADDAVRASYGRSVEFLTGQTFGTPASLTNFTPFLNVPAVPGFTCGSGVPNAPFAGPCKNYAQQLLYDYDQDNDAPDLGNALYAAYNNYDFTYQHQFKNGFGMRVTPFYRQGFNVPGFSLLSATVNPVTQQLQSFVFTVNNNNASKTSGLEFALTTPQRPYGFSGFFSATYQNVLDRVTPLLSGEDTLPDVFDSSIALADTYRAGYVTPLTMKIGGEFKTKGGLRINPIVTYIRGYPYTIGSTVASNGLCGINANVPQVNFGCGTTFIPGYGGVSAGFSQSGQVSTQYVDPALPGNSFTPNIAATRGTPQTAASGGVLSNTQITANLDVEYTVGKRQTIGLLVQNLFGNQYIYATPASGDTQGAIPQINPYYQPVATGVSGPQTGHNALANPAYAGGIYANRGEANPAGIAYGTSPYITVPTMPTTYTLYYQLHL